MKKSLLFCLPFLVLLSSIVSGEEAKIITSKTLTISDMESYLVDPQSIKDGFDISIVGVHQIKNTATVYRNYCGKMQTHSLIRFNSGKWYNPKKKEFVRKKY